MTTNGTVHTGRLRKIRFLVGYAAIVGTLPYLTLKLAWLSGGTLGLREPEFVDTPTMYAANLFTGGMVLVAILLALTFTHAWGLRVPAGPLLFPIWVGTGYLAPIALGIPVIGLSFFTDEGGGGAMPLEAWVTPLVYASFAWQGFTLLTAFALYARVRWARLFTGYAAPGRLGLLGGTGALVAVVTGAVQLGRVVVPDGDASAAMRFMDGVDGVLAFAAAAAMLVIARGNVGFRLPMVLVWVGSADLFAWGLWRLFSSLGNGEIGVRMITEQGQVLGGILLALALLAKARVVTQEPLSTGRAAG
ncbi:hypothetical protein [Qaidamihabitans albus]|uniref:hypothetical protein n=1 Tax=Qaidamihabitans albus TaxID=2795733 RepID=UPI0018F1F9DF|nr:hypothetical protein [Qaidamihabitans albus]